MMLGPAATSGWFVTGTDTEIGKTLVACTLLRKLRERGLRAIGMKPVAAGCEEVGGVWRNRDVTALAAASSPGFEPADANPYLFREAVAPHIAAARAGLRIDVGHILDCHARLASLADAVVVEGVGGFLVPLGEDFDAADLAVALALPIVLVVGMRLGCINHALLTAEAIVARNLKLAGWVANRIDAGMARFDDNVETLRRRLPAPLLGVLPWLPSAEPALAAACLELPAGAAAPTPAR